MTKKESLIIKGLLKEIDTLQSWLEDTGYPRLSRIALSEALEDVKNFVKEKEEVA